MSALALVMPMAGRGSRFKRGGRLTPKPLIELAGRPFFAWAMESVLSAAPVRQVVAVVLEEHVREFAIDAAIRRVHPETRIVVLDEVTAGAAETAARGVAQVVGSGPIAVNDCDHAFSAIGLADIASALESDLHGALVGFPSTSPAYAYARLGAAGLVEAVVEKQPISPNAIAGCYLFRSPAVFAEALDAYRGACPYDELFVSGLFEQLLRQGGRVGYRSLAQHVSFGTPEELAAVSLERMAGLFGERVERP